MDGTTQYNLIFYIGVGLMSVSVIGGLLAFAIQRRAGKQLQDQLDAEYGEKRR